MTVTIDEKGGGEKLLAHGLYELRQVEYLVFVGDTLL